MVKRKKLAKEFVTQLFSESSDRMDMTSMELAAEKVKEEVGRATVEALLAKLPPEDLSPKRCPKCGKPVPVKAAKRERTFRCLSGTHTVVRNYHYCEDCREGFYPRDIELGLPKEGELTLEMEKRVLDFGVNDTFEQSAERWNVHYNEPISSNLVRRVVDRVGRQCEACPEEQMQLELKEPPLKPSDLLIVQNDGSMLPMRGEEAWKEAKVAVIVRGDQYVSHREAPRGQISSARYVAVLGDQEEFAEAVDAALHVERASEAKQVVWVGDGARMNWNLAQKACRHAVQILDWDHAVQNGVTCGKALLGDGDYLLSTWQKRIEALLYAGDVRRLIHELMDCIEYADDEQLKSIDDLVRYYRANAERMRYSEFRARGLLIGSGFVESAHRHVLQVRMKRAGQHWDPPRARRMARLRAAYRTAGPGNFHLAIQSAFARTATVKPQPRPQIRASNR